jgi:putative glutamine amidotransferase
VSHPTIGITIAYDHRRAEHHVLRQDYVRATETAGGLPVVLAPVSEGLIEPLLDRLDGLILSGGSDVDPALYGEQPHPKLGRVVRERDDFELALTRKALARDLPILAICRGHQVLNVAMGGTLIQDIASQWRGSAAHDHDSRRERWLRAHEVRILPGTRVREILGKDVVAVNSFHHQAVRDLGEGLVVSAISSDDRVVEAVEKPSASFVLGVQWHPESFWNQSDGFQPLFEALVRASG